ncbi:uncharacterized protein STEHIDRAFT_163091 [Stereum hirsutum FP-91666 SS1]|uniref:F-box domain-containing protein n=1 Tax=Stereum hirsutum (strain FP-91666) TaxID=721885 RepID=R7RZG2_STEHR|nr:uncharacterized protein STEHIDRAFT_163091 [Stereum hirsutum FP-91666 SS1]EIM80218.1 hypothetical protein STEHIDRAFT_163091 [Stereum hirsutum FP-91666 SS1]
MSALHLIPQEPPSPPFSVVPLTSLLGWEDSDSNGLEDPEDSVSDLNQHSANADESNQLPADPSPIAQLPSETLITIFLESVAHDTPSSSNLGWVQITHVCRFWRDLALHSPLLWTNIPLRLGRECMEEFIRRSNSAPLKLYHAPGPNVLPLSEVPIESIRHRVYSISIGYTTNAQERAHKFIDDLLQSAPSLEEIRIAGMREPGSGFGIVIDSTLGFDSPRHFFTRSVPLLRKLSLHSISPIPWSAFPFHNLTRLEISSQLWDLPRDGTEDHTIISSLLDLLKTTPDLETLELCNSLPNNRKKNSQIIPLSPFVVSLVRLSTIIVRGGQASIIGRLLQSLRLPSFTNGHFECAYSGRRDFHVILEALRMLLPICFARLTPATHNPKSQNLGMIYELESGSSASNERSTTSVQLITRGHKDLLSDACLELLQDVRHLRLDNISWKSSKRWQNAFAPLKQVEEVTFVSREGDYFLRALEPISSATDGWEDKPLFPELRRLHLVGASLDVKVYNLFRRRLRLGPSFQHVVMDNCTVSENVVKWFGELGLDVVWDGVTTSVDQGQVEDDEIEDDNGVENRWPPQ